MLTASVHYPWMYYLPYGLAVTLKPLFKNDTEFVSIRSCKWVTPGQVALYPDMRNFDVDRYSIDKARCQLTIYNNQKDTNGIYHCVINDVLISKAMLNVHGAPKSSLLEEYTPNLIAGFSTFGGVIALFAFTCGIHKYRYKSPKSNLFCFYFLLFSKSKRLNKIAKPANFAVKKKQRSGKSI